MKVFFDASVGGRAGELCRRAEACGFAIASLLEGGVDCVVLNSSQMRRPLAAGHASKRTKRMLAGAQSERRSDTIEDQSRQLGIRVLEEQDFIRAHLGPREREALVARGKSSTTMPPPLVHGSVSLMSSSRPMAAGVRPRPSSWERFKPPQLNEVVRVAVRDLDGLYSDRSRTFSNTKLDSCRVHPDAPPKLSFFVPRDTWPQTLPRENERDLAPLEPASAPGASEGKNVAAVYSEGAVEDDVMAAAEAELSTPRAKVVPIPQGARAKAHIGGHCECCGVNFTGTVEQHCLGGNHQNYLANESNFSTFDAFVASLRGLPHPAPTTVDIGAIDTPLASASLPQAFERASTLNQNVICSRVDDDLGHTFAPQVASTALPVALAPKNNIKNCAPKKPKVGADMSRSSLSSRPHGFMVSPALICPRARSWQPPPAASATAVAAAAAVRAQVARLYKRQATAVELVAVHNPPIRHIPCAVDEVGGNKRGRFVGRHLALNNGQDGHVEGSSYHGGRHRYSVVYGDGDREEMSSEELEPFIQEEVFNRPEQSAPIKFSTAKVLLSSRSSNVSGGAELATQGSDEAASLVVAAAQLGAQKGGSMEQKDEMLSLSPHKPSPRRQSLPRGAKDLSLAQQVAAAECRSQTGSLASPSVSMASPSSRRSTPTASSKTRAQRRHDPIKMALAPDARKPGVAFSPAKKTREKAPSKAGRQLAPRGAAAAPPLPLTRRNPKTRKKNYSAAEQESAPGNESSQDCDGNGGRWQKGEFDSPADDFEPPSLESPMSPCVIC